MQLEKIPPKNLRDAFQMQMQVGSLIRGTEKATGPWAAELVNW
jgi:hypothetical protein